MARTESDRIRFVRAALQNHTSFWDNQRPLMRKYKNVYMTTFYRDVDMVADTSIRVETADAYAAVESLMGSLFTKYPGVEIGDDITGKGDAQTVKELSNNFLKTARQQIENAARMALIYTHSFLKLAPRESTTILGKVALRAIPPWQVILDRDAAAWEDARFVGHVYYISVDEANEKFGYKKWHGVAQKDYFTDFERNTDRSYKSYGDTSGGDLPNEYLYIEIVEMYDFLNDELLFWSAQWKNGEELLSKDKIPVTTFDDRPLSNIVPFYFSRSPDRPMEGYSTLGRVYDQCFEKNILRTFWANAVRRDSRQYIYKEGAFDEDALAKITSGVDGAMVPTDSDDALNTLISQVPVSPISSNHAQYLNYIEADIQRGAMTAGFTRGEASKATATEVSVLAQYTASELGKMARDRDSVIESAVALYVRMLIPLVDDNEKTVIVTPSGAKIVTVANLDADWTVYAIDGGSTPLTDALRKNQIMQLLPSLAQLGVPPLALKEEVIRLFGLPESFAKEVPAPEVADTQSDTLPVSTPSPTTPTNIGGV